MKLKMATALKIRCIINDLSMGRGFTQFMMTCIKTSCLLKAHSNNITKHYTILTMVDQCGKWVLYK